MKKLSILPLLLLCSCVSIGKDVDPNKFATLENGKTTYNEAVSILGTPNQVDTLDDGGKKISYIRATAKPTPASFIPVIGMFVGGVDSTTKTVSLTFDKKDILKSTSNSITNIGKDGLSLGN